MHFADGCDTTTWWYYLEDCSMLLHSIVLNHEYSRPCNVSKMSAASVGLQNRKLIFSKRII